MWTYYLSWSLNVICVYFFVYLDPILIHETPHSIYCNKSFPHISKSWPTYTVTDILECVCVCVHCFNRGNIAGMRSSLAQAPTGFPQSRDSVCFIRFHLPKGIGCYMYLGICMYNNNILICFYRAYNSL